MITETTIMEHQTVWVERTISFEADSIEHAKELLGKNTLEELNVEYGDSNYIMDTVSSIDIENIHDNQTFKEI
jgi:hypothetical protein